MNQQQILSEKIKIGISLCCIGAPVRYNQLGWDMIGHLGREKGDYIFFPVCPECMAGLGVPRDAIRLSGGTGEDVLMGQAKVVSGKKEITKQLLDGSQVCLDVLKKNDVKVFVYKEGSPSCGVYRTTLRNQSRGKPPGVFGAMVLEEGMFLIPADDLQSPIKWWDWRRRMFAWVWLSEQPLLTRANIIDTWHVLKFLCEEIDRPYTKAMGLKIAQIAKEDVVVFGEQLRSEVMELLRQPVPIQRISNRLWKHYVHYRKKTNQTVDEVNPPTTLRSKTKIAQELLLMERKSFESGVLFGSSPVIYRDKRRIKHEE